MGAGATPSKTREDLADENRRRKIKRIQGELCTWEKNPLTMISIRLSIITAYGHDIVNADRLQVTLDRTH